MNRHTFLLGIKLSVYTLLLMFCWVAETAAQVNDYYVSAAGSDAGNGTPASPWATIQKAINSFSPGSSGTVIHVGSGSYTTSVSCSGIGTVGVCINRGGTSRSSRLVIQCDSAVGSARNAVGKCKISGPGMGVGMIGASNVDLVGFDIGNTPSMATGIFGIAGSTGDSFHILSNYIHDLAQSATGPEGVGCPQSGAILTNNGSHQDYQVVGNIIVRYGAYPAPNCFNAHGIYSAANSVIENNVIAATPSSNIQVHSNACNVVISNNVLLSSQSAIILDNASNGCSTPGKNTINNNIMANHSKWHIQDGPWNGGTAQCTSSSPNFWGHNITDGVNADINNGAPYSCDTFSPAVSLIHESPSSTFVSYRADGSGDYHLNSQSLAVDAGTTTCTSGGMSPCTPIVDLDGLTRSGSISIGAYEPAGTVSGTPAAPTGLTATVQ